MYENLIEDIELFLKGRNIKYAVGFELPSKFEKKKKQNSMQPYSLWNFVTNLNFNLGGFVDSNER